MTDTAGGEINVGDRVRSYDFPGMRDDCWIEGKVIGFAVKDGCARYKIKVEKQIVMGEEMDGIPADIIYPPINGTPMIGDRVCDGVRKIN